jgi:LmbE family N-acetylglucosaminyl deacetylase
VAHWTAQGKKIVYCLVTSGEAGIDGIPPEKARTIREEEQRASASQVGVEVIDFLGFPDGILEYVFPCGAPSPGRSASTGPRCC